MPFWDRALKAVGLIREKAVDIYPTVYGGPEILTSWMPQWDSWSKNKRMRAYEKSLYLFACINKIATKVASIELEMYRITNADGDKEEVFVHEGLDLMYRPNPFQTKEEFFQRWITNKKLAGETFVLKVRDNSGNVRELWNLRPDFTRIVFDSQTVIRGYEFIGPKGAILFKPEDIIHDAYPDPMSDFSGISPLQPASVRIDTEEFATKYQKNFFRNNARPDFILKTDKKLNEQQKTEIKEAWDKRHKGSKNAGKGAFLEGGLDYQQVSISQREMDYIESMKFTRDDILVSLGVPKPIVAITEDVNYANANTAMEVFLSETITPEIRQMVNKLNEHLIYPEYGDNFYLGYEDPVPENETEKADIQQKRITAGTMLINEAREEWGDEPVKGGWSLYMGIGMQPVGGLPQGANDSPSAESNEEKAAKDKRKRIFRGRSNAYKMLQIKDAIKADMLRALKIEVKEDAKPRKVSLIKAEVREIYSDMVLKAIDARGKSMEEPINQFMEAQKARFIKALKLTEKAVDPYDEKGTLDQKFSAGGWREAAKKWAKEEQKLVAEFSLPFIADFVKQAGINAMETVAPAETFDEKTERVQTYIKTRAKDLGKTTTATTLDDLSHTLAEGIASDESIAELRSRVDDEYAFFPQFRSAMIARTESTSANNKGFIEAYKQSNVANAKEWIATEDSRTRESHSSIDGDIVGLDEDFANGLSFPGDPSGDAEETINCRCVLGPAFAE